MTSAQLHALSNGAARFSRPTRGPRPTSRDLARHIISFDPDDPLTYAPFSLPQAAMANAAIRSPILWPEGQAPLPAPLPAPPPEDAALPQFDYLVVTWTVAEAKCLADTLTPGHPSKTDWYRYTHNFATDFLPQIRRGAPARHSMRLGSWFPAEIAGKRVMCFKSELHLSQDGQKMPVAALWRQLIAEVRPKLVITTGTAGGIGSGVELGDVVVAQSVRFDCLKEFKSRPFHASSYDCSPLDGTSFAVAQELFAANAGRLPAAPRPPAIFAAAGGDAPPPDIVTTDFFAFDDTSDTFRLQGLGGAVEMGDAVLGLVAQELGPDAPRWVAVRNASDPQIQSDGLSEKAAATKAAQIYERYGYWTTIPSAIACWALILDN